MTPVQGQVETHRALTVAELAAWSERLRDESEVARNRADHRGEWAAALVNLSRELGVRFGDGFDA